MLLILLVLAVLAVAVTALLAVLAVVLLMRERRAGNEHRGGGEDEVTKCFHLDLQRLAQENFPHPGYGDGERE